MPKSKKRQQRAQKVSELRQLIASAQHKLKGAYSPAEAAHYLGISLRLLQQVRKKFNIPPVTMVPGSTKKVFRRVDLDESLKLWRRYTAKRESRGGTTARGRAALAQQGDLDRLADGVPLELGVTDPHV